MASTISAGTTTTTALVYSADTSGVLQLQTNGGTTALTLDTSQNATFAGKVASASSLQLATNGTTTAITVDTLQNVGVGVTPSAWQSGFKAIQLSGLASWNVDGSTAGSGTYFANNVYRDPTNTRWQYLVTGDNATQYVQASGQHIWRTAASGTAGNAITFNQAMTLDTSGNLNVGTTTNTYSSILNVLGNSQVTGRRRGYVFANGTSAGTTGTYTVSVTGYAGYGSGAGNDVSSYFFVTFLSTAYSHEVHGVALYGNIYNGNAILLATLGTSIVAGGGISFGASGASPTITITNSSGSTPTYYCQVCYIN